MEKLILISDDKTDQSVNFLDLHLEIKNQHFSYRLFDQRDKLISDRDFSILEWKYT